MYRTNIHSGFFFIIISLKLECTQMSIFATGVIISGYIHMEKYYAAVKMNKAEQHTTCVNFTDAKSDEIHKTPNCVYA